MNTVPGHRGTVRFSNTREFPHETLPSWQPEDVDAFADELDLYAGNSILVAYVHRRGLDVDICARVFLHEDSPWAQEREVASWVLYIENDREVAVIEYATAALAEAAFYDHVAMRHNQPTMYTYVTDSRDPQTAMPAAPAVPVTIGDVLFYTSVIDAARTGSRVERRFDATAAVTHATALGIRDADGEVPDDAADIRQCYLMATLANRTTAWWPLAELMREQASGAFQVCAATL